MIRPGLPQAFAPHPLAVRSDPDDPPGYREHCPCQWGPCGRCQDGRCDLCAADTGWDGGGPEPLTYIEARDRSALTPVWAPVGARDCSWRCPCHAAGHPRRAVPARARPVQAPPKPEEVLF